MLLDNAEFTVARLLSWCVKTVFWYAFVPLESQIYDPSKLGISFGPNIRLSY